MNRSHESCKDPASDRPVVNDAVAKEDDGVEIKKSLWSKRSLIIFMSAYRVRQHLSQKVRKKRESKLLFENPHKSSSSSLIYARNFSYAMENKHHEIKC